MFDKFKSRAEAVSAEVHRFQTKSGAFDFIMQFLKNEGVADSPQSRAVWAECSFLDGLDRKHLADEIPGLTFDVTRDAAADSKVGITQMDWAMANTGTLVQDSTQVAQRLASSLPVIHMALVASDTIVEDMPSLLKRINLKGIGYMSMITGPSRTADIERVLTIGVHGPERLIIVFVDGPGGLNR